MILYEVNLFLDPAISEKYLKWLGLHIQEILKIKGFLGAEVFKVHSLEKEVFDKEPWTVHYRLDSLESFESYIQNHAAKLRAEAEKHFGGHFKVTRRLLELH